MVDGVMKILPENVVIYILLKFPVKFLLRFQCVSKTCNNLIQSSIFINLHLDHTKSVRDEFIVFKRSLKEEFHRYKTVLSFLSIGADDSINPILPDFDVPYMTGTDNMEYDLLIGPCKGLVALMDDFITVLFNPSTRNYRLLPPSPFNCPRNFHRRIKCVGFGFDSIVNDFKVVRIFEIYGEDQYRYPIEEGEKVEVYELGIDLWRELDRLDHPLPMFFWLPCSQIFYKGAFHWIAERLILCFDMSTEIFRNMKMPNTHDFSKGKRYSLVILDESLTLICYPCLVPVIDKTKDLMDIWMMKDYDVYVSWIKKYSIRGIPIETPLAVWNEYLFLFQSRSESLMFCDLNTTEMKEINLHGCPRSMRVTIFKECLTPIPSGSENSTHVQNF